MSGRHYMVDGRQRLQNLRTKVNIIARRDLQEFLAGRLDILPCSGDRLDDEIAREFDRLAAQPAGGSS